MSTGNHVGYLVLESGEVYQGCYHQDPRLASQALPGRAGEVVFNTSHSGYEEVATDPSYFSQIVVMTAPMQGNYGIQRSAWESKKIWIEGFVCLQMLPMADDHQDWQSLLLENSVPVLSEVDTRQIVLRLRSGGTTWGAVLSADSPSAAVTQAKELIAAKKKQDRDWAWLVSCRQTETAMGENPEGAHIGVIDFGCKENIMRELLSRSKKVSRFPARVSAQDILQSGVDGLLLSNGPGDPGDVQIASEVVRELIGKLPIFGICMGHQILGLALGAKTYKLPFGHRGSNHPMQDDLLNKVYITSQNHGYAVDSKTLPADVRVTQVNLNDQTVAGFYSEKRRCLGIQYHPESHPGPHDATGLFDFFTQKMIHSKELQ